MIGLTSSKGAISAYLCPLQAVFKCSSISLVILDVEGDGKGDGKGDGFGIMRLLSFFSFFLKQNLHLLFFLGLLC